MTVADLDHWVPGGNVPPAGADEEDAIEALASWQAVDLTAAVNGDMVRPAPSILRRSDGQALFYEGQLNWVHGADGVGKSFVAVFAAIEVLADGGHVVWLDYEDPDEATIIARLLDLGVQPRRILDGFHYIHPETEATPSAVCAVIDVIRAHGARLAVIDSIGEAFGVDGVNEDRDNEVAPWIRRVLRPLVAAGPAVLVIDHGVKNSDNPLHPSGSKRKRAAVTGSHFVIEAPRPISAEYAGGQLLLTTAKDRHGYFTRGKPAAVIDVAIYPDGGWSSHVHPPSVSKAATSGSDNDKAIARAAVRAVVELETEAGPDGRVTRGMVEQRMNVKARATAKRAGIEYAVAVGALAEEAGARGAKHLSFVHHLDVEDDAA